MIAEKEFVKIIDALELQSKVNVEFAENLGKAFKNAFVANLLPDDETLVNAVISLLKENLGDTNDWIDYYIYELEFGKKFKKGMVKDKNGKNFLLSNPKQLYKNLKK